MSDPTNQTTAERRDGLHCVYGTCHGLPCHPGCSFTMRPITDDQREHIERLERSVVREGDRRMQDLLGGPTRLGVIGMSDPTRTPTTERDGLFGAWISGIIVGLGLAGVLMFLANAWDRAHWVCT